MADVWAVPSCERLTVAISARFWVSGAPALAAGSTPLTSSPLSSPWACDRPHFRKRFDRLRREHHFDDARSRIMEFFHDKGTGPRGGCAATGSHVVPQGGLRDWGLSQVS